MTTSTAAACRNQAAAGPTDPATPPGGTVTSPLTDQPLDLDQIEARAAAATPGPWGLYDDGTGLIDIAADLQDTGHGYRCRRYVGQLEAAQIDNTPTHRDWTEEQDRAQVQADAEFIAHARTDVDALLAEIRRLRADAAAELLPAWEAVYEPGNVSDYLIGYTNDRDAATAAAEAWLRSQAEVTGRLEWVHDDRLAVERYDRWFELVEHHDDGIPTGPGLIVRRRVAAAEETHVVADDSDNPDRCSGCRYVPCPDCAAVPAAARP